MGLSVTVFQLDYSSGFSLQLRYRQRCIPHSGGQEVAGFPFQSGSQSGFTALPGLGLYAHPWCTTLPN